MVRKSGKKLLSNKKKVPISKKEGAPLQKLPLRFT